MKNILDFFGKVFEFIYDFLFNWEDDPYEQENFIESEKIKHSLIKSENKNIDAINRDYMEIVDIFGRNAADYVYNLKKEVTFLVDKHDLIRENIIKVVIPPEKLMPGNISPRVFEELIEGIYAQYNKDVILKPGKITVTKTSSGVPFVEIEVESYTVNEALLSSV